MEQISWATPWYCGYSFLILISYFGSAIRRIASFWGFGEYCPTKYHSVYHTQGGKMIWVAHRLSQKREKPMRANPRNKKVEMTTNKFSIELNTTSDKSIGADDPVLLRLTLNIIIFIIINHIQLSQYWLILILQYIFQTLGVLYT